MLQNAEGLTVADALHMLSNGNTRSSVMSQPRFALDTKVSSNRRTPTH